MKVRKTYEVINESTEDIIGIASNIELAVDIAERALKHYNVGEFVLITHEGKGVRQFVLMEDGTVKENVVG